MEFGWSAEFVLRVLLSWEGWRKVVQEDRAGKWSELVPEEMCKEVGTGRSEACRKKTAIWEERLVFTADRWEVWRGDWSQRRAVAGW